MPRHTELEANSENLARPRQLFEQVGRQVARQGYTARVPNHHRNRLMTYMSIVSGKRTLLGVR